MAVVNVEPYLRLISEMKGAPQKNLWMFYDEEADVLYINFRKPSVATDSEMTDDAISSAVAPYGYDEAAFQEGTARTDAFAAALQERQDTYGRQQSATDALGDAWDAFHEKTYMPHVTIARLVFADGTRGRLGIEGRRPRSFDAYLQEAHRFYGTLSGDADIRDPEKLVDLLHLFFGYEEPAHEEWTRAVADFKDRVPRLGAALQDTIETEREENDAFRRAFQDFLEMCRQAINPNVSRAAVEEMLIQHLLTDPLLLAPRLPHHSAARKPVTLVAALVASVVPLLPAVRQRPSSV